MRNLRNKIKSSIKFCQDSGLEPQNIDNLLLKSSST